MLTKQRESVFEIKAVSEQGIVSGILNHFGNKDHAKDITLAGAFAKSLKTISDSGRPLVLLWQHQHDKPIGIWKNLRETERGLEGDAHLNLDTALGREAFALVKQGAVSGFSIGYYVMDEFFDRHTDTNYLKELDLLETSLVTFPCNDLSRVGEIKMKLNFKGLPTVEELNVFLTANGVKQEDADRITSKFFPDHRTDAELKAERDEAQKQVEALIAQFGLKYVVDEAAEDSTVDEVKEQETAEVEPEEKTEDESEEEAAPAEKSGSLAAFFK